MSKRVLQSHAARRVCLSDPSLVALCKRINQRPRIHQGSRAQIKWNKLMRAPQRSNAVACARWKFIHCGTLRATNCWLVLLPRIKLLKNNATFHYYLLICLVLWGLDIFYEAEGSQGKSFIHLFYFIAVFVEYHNGNFQKQKILLLSVNLSQQRHIGHK